MSDKLNIRISVRVPTSLAAEIAEKAVSNGVTVSEELRRALKARYAQGGEARTRIE